MISWDVMMHVSVYVCACQWRPFPCSSYHLTTSDVQTGDSTNVVIYIAPFKWLCTNLGENPWSVSEFPSVSFRHLQSGSDAQETWNNKRDAVKQNPSLSLSTGHRKWTQPKPGQCHPINCLTLSRSVWPVYRSSKHLFDYPLSRSVHPEVIQWTACLDLGQCNLWFHSGHPIKRGLLKRPSFQNWWRICPEEYTEFFDGWTFMPKLRVIVWNHTFGNYGCLWTWCFLIVVHLFLCLVPGIHECH